MVPTLPQNDSNPTQRSAALNEQRQNYQYNRSKLPGLAMADNVPGKDQSFSKFKWIQDAISLMLRVSMNQRLQDINERGVQLVAAIRLLSGIWLYNLLNDPRRANFLQRLLTRFQFLIQRQFQKSDKSQKPTSKIIEELDVELKEDTKFIAKSATELAKLITARRDHDVDTTISTELGESLQDYKAYFKPYNDLFQIIYLPAVSDRFYDDNAFTAQRVAGPNPLVIEKVSHLPDNFAVTEAHYKAVMGPADSLTKAGAEGRLYLADYKVLAGVKTGIAEGEPKYLCAPLALFAVPVGERSLQPVAIQCGQQSGLPIFGPPPAGTPQPKKWAWLMAKTIVQTADGNYHELISHLGRTHLLIE
ncbi:MAG: lipoxygenase family protein, partial [Cyanobacteria bacterium P01_D01_bin.56]